MGAARARRRPEVGNSQNLLDFPYAAYAEMLGLRGYRVEEPAEVGPAWDEALRADRPCVLDVRTDPKVPPLPPHISYEQAKKYTQALLKGDSEAVGIIWQSFKESMHGVLPSRR